MFRNRLGGQCQCLLFITFVLLSSSACNTLLGIDEQSPSARAGAGGTEAEAGAAGAGVSGGDAGAARGGAGGAATAGAPGAGGASGGNSNGCDLRKPFAAPQDLLFDDMTRTRTDARLSSDELTIFYGSDDKIFVATRKDLNAKFSDVRDLEYVGAGVRVGFPALTEDLSTIFFCAFADTTQLYRAKLSNKFDVSDATLLSKPDAWACDPYLLPSGTALYFAGWNGSNWNLMRTPEPASIASAELLPVVNSLAKDAFPVVSADEKTLYFASNRTLDNSVQLRTDTWVARRSDAQADFGVPEPVSELNTPDTNTLPSWISPDGCRIYIHRDVGISSKVMFAARQK